MAGQIAHLLNGEGGQDIGVAAQQPAAHFEAIVVQVVVQAGAGGEDGLGLGSGSAVRVKEEGQVQNGDGRGVGGKVGGRDEHAFNGAVLHALDHLGSGAQLAGGIELHRDGAAGGLFDAGLELLHGHVLLMLAAGGRAQADGVAAGDLGVAAGGFGGGRSGGLGSGGRGSSSRGASGVSAAGGQDQGQGQGDAQNQREFLFHRCVPSFLLLEIFFFLEEMGKTGQQIRRYDGNRGPVPALFCIKDYHKLPGDALECLPN